MVPWYSYLVLPYCNTVVTHVYHRGIYTCALALHHPFGVCLSKPHRHFPTGRALRIVTCGVSVHSSSTMASTPPLQESSNVSRTPLRMAPRCPAYTGSDTSQSQQSLKRVHDIPQHGRHRSELEEERDSLLSTLQSRNQELAQEVNLLRRRCADSNDTNATVLEECQLLLDKAQAELRAHDTNKQALAQAHAQALQQVSSGSDYTCVCLYFCLCMCRLFAKA
jgi:hypothetical protein